MAHEKREQGRTQSAYAGLDFIKAAFCPLEFTAMKLGQHSEFKQLRRDGALASLEVGTQLHYPRQFPFTDPNGHRKTGTQIITAPFGLAPKDFDLFLGLYTYLRRLPELPKDGRSHLTVDFIARTLGLPATCQKDYLRIRSRIFRFSFVKYTNTAFWNSQTKTYDIVNFGFFNIAALSRVTESRRPVTFEWDPSFLRLVTHSAHLAFDYELYRTLSPTLRRFYLIANRDGWNQRDSSVFVADNFAVHQIGYSDSPDMSRDRLYKLRKLLGDAEDLGLIRPCAAWGSYMKSASQGPFKDRLLLRWSRGPNLRTKEDRPAQATVEDFAGDALFAQAQELRDEHGRPLDAKTYARLRAEFSKEKIQKHVLVVLAQKEHHAGSFQRSEIAAFIDRLQKDHPEPDWYQDLKRAERLSPFAGSQPNQLSLEMYETFFRE
jgi:hypothetical protein